MTINVDYCSFSMIPLMEVPEGTPQDPKDPPIEHVLLTGGQKRDGVWYAVGTVSATWRDDLKLWQRGGRLFVQVKPILEPSVTIWLT